MAGQEIDQSAFYLRDLAKQGVEVDPRDAERLTIGLVWAGHILNDDEAAAVWASGMPAEQIRELDEAFTGPDNNDGTSHDREPLQPLPRSSPGAVALVV